MPTMVDGIDLDMLLEDLACTKRRLWKVEIQQDCIIGFLKAVLSKDDAEMLDAYLQNELSDEPVEIPLESRAMLAALHVLVIAARKYSDQQAIRNCWGAKPCRGDEDPINSLAGVSSRLKPEIPRKYRG